MIRSKRNVIVHLRTRSGLRLCAAAVVVLSICFPPQVVAQSESAGQRAEEELASRAVAILQVRCFSCHGAEKSESGLRLDSLEHALGGGDQGAAIVAGNALDSLLVKSIRDAGEDSRMPPKDPLKDAEIDVIVRWITAGARWPVASAATGSEMKPASSMDGGGAIGNALEDPRNPIRVLFGGDRLELWSLRPIERPAIPQVEHGEWPRNPIDNFVLAEWERSTGLEIGAVAEPRALAMRAAFDLTGLPPSFEEIERFANDGDTQSYEQLIDRWLADPSYGVRWGRMWLDVVRYSDSNGFDWDEFRPQAWRYRDYVVDAWNRDLPFDQFTREQLAGDELVGGPPNDELDQQRWIATGYLRVGPHDNSSPLFNEQDRSRAQLMADLTETTGSAFLGLTLGCCRCHDHKTDPLSHADHYRLQAFFAPVEFADDVPLDLPERREEIEQHNAAIDEKVAGIDQQHAAIHAEVKSRLTPSDEKAEVSDEVVKKALTAEEKKRVSELNASKTKLNETKLAYTRGLLMRDKAKDIPATYVLYQGDHKAPRELVTAGFPSVLEPGETAIVAASDSSTGRRSTLADWMVARKNPWTARVIVNRLWQAHFGEGLVATANDFGVTGARPSHPELLDWLASELIDSGWSIKHVQRLIVTSSVYRQATLSAQVEARVAKSYRKKLRRLEAEALRDRILTASGLLDRRIGGPPVWPEIPAEILQANPAFLDDNATKTKGWYPSPAESQAVRSLFLVQKRTVRIPFLETFDLPDNSVSCARRESSLVAPQALTLMNGVQVEQASEAMADLVAAESGDVQTQVAIVFQRALLRRPRSAELELAKKFLETHSLPELCRAVLNTNEFAFVD